MKIANHMILKEKAEQLVAASRPMRQRGNLTRVRPTPIAIIGAGPYGLSIAAHLRACGLEFRIFGRPMETWWARMPTGMFLKSEGFASDLYDSDQRFTLKQFCAQSGLTYGDIGVPIPLETMVAYGLSFQERLVPDLENRAVVALDRSPEGFLLRLDNGEEVSARKVIVAIGYSCFRYVPASLADLPAEFLSHSSEHHDLSRFKGQDVTVVGGGASALDLAALLHEAGAEVRLVARRPSLAFLPKAEPRSIWHRIRFPMTGIGGGWRSRFFTDAPMLFRYLPRDIRLNTIKNYLGPAGGWWTRDLTLGQLPVLCGCTPQHAEIANGGVHLQLSGAGAQSEIMTQHVIAATGYRVDLHRLSFLSEKIRYALKSLGGMPLLSRDFQSSVVGLYFVGLASAHDFGPVMRFMFGAGYTARRLSNHLSRVAESSIMCTTPRLMKGRIQQES